MFELDMFTKRRIYSHTGPAPDHALSYTSTWSKATRRPDAFKYP